MAKDESIFIEEMKEGVRGDNFRIVVADSLFALTVRVNELTKDGEWGVIGAAFESTAGWCWSMARITDKTVRQSIA